LGKIIESCFPAKEISELVKKEIRNPRAYQYIHPWPGRLPGILFRALILASLLDENELDLYWHLLKIHEKVDIGRGKVFLDPFVGSGTSLVEALSLGMRAIGVDVNSVAWLISRSTLLPVNIQEIQRAGENVIKNVSLLVDRLYTTHVNGRSVKVKAFYWVRSIHCEKCGSKVELFKTYKLAKDGNKVWIYCPFCHNVFLAEDTVELKCPACGRALKPVSWGQFYKCPTCGYVGKIREAIKDSEKPETELFAILFQDGKRVGVKLATEEDLALYREAEKLLDAVPEDFLSLSLKYGEETSRLLRYGYRNVRELFNARQLLVIYYLSREISKLYGETRDLLALALSKTAAFSTIITPYRYIGGKPENSFSLHQYMFEKMFMEINILEGIRGSFHNNLERLLEAKRYTDRAIGNIRISASLDGADAVILLAPAQRLRLAPSTVDLIVTDPPHFNNVVNSGIADFHYAVLKSMLKNDYREFQSIASCSHEDELVYDKKRGKDIESYKKNLVEALSNAVKALKPAGLFVTIFRHRSEEAWRILRTSLKYVGLEFVKEWPLDLENYPQPQARFKGRVRSAVLVYRKE
jgi:adenine-specific DNA methylase